MILPRPPHSTRRRACARTTKPYEQANETESSRPNERLFGSMLAKPNLRETEHERRTMSSERSVLCSARLEVDVLEVGEEELELVLLCERVVVDEVRRVEPVLDVAVVLRGERRERERGRAHPAERADAHLHELAPVRRRARRRRDRLVERVDARARRQVLDQPREHALALGREGELELEEVHEDLTHNTRTRSIESKDDRSSSSRNHHHDRNRTRSARPYARGAAARWRGGRESARTTRHSRAPLRSHLHPCAPPRHDDGSL